MEPHIPSLEFLTWIVGFVSFFSFLAVVSWVRARLRERQAFYKSETIKKIAESQGGSSALEYLRDGDRAEGESSGDPPKDQDGQVQIHAAKTLPHWLSMG